MGAWVENKNVSLTFHYREAPMEMHTGLHLEAAAIIEALGYIVCPAHYAIEAKPPVQWNKGKLKHTNRGVISTTRSGPLNTHHPSGEAALKILCDRFGNDWATHVRAIYAGDDTSDEDAMRALQGTGRSFRVAASADIRTYADYRLACTKGVTMLLDWIEQTL